MKFILPKDYPKKLHIGGETYRIIFVKGFKHLGETDAEKRTIKLRAGMSPRETFLTWIHEVGHALEFEFGIKIKHSAIYAYSIAIVELLMDNF